MKKFSYFALVIALLLPATAVLAQQKMGDMKPMDSDMKSSGGQQHELASDNHGVHGQ